MKILIKTGLVIIIIGWMMNCPVGAQDQPLKIEMKGEKAQVTLLIGKADIVNGRRQSPGSLRKGSYIKQGDTISLNKNSRLEIRFPDGSYVRFDELTTFTLENLEMDEKQTRRNIQIFIGVGKVWSNVYKTIRGSFDLKTSTSVAGVRGTVYRVNVRRDQSASVWVYGGDVSVQSIEFHKVRKPDEIPFPSGGDTVYDQPRKTDKPHAVSGPKTVTGPSSTGKPQAIAGPKKVSSQEWSYMLKAMQRIDIAADGVPDSPSNFDETADLNEWVKWNRERDRELHIAP